MESSSEFHQPNNEKKYLKTWFGDLINSFDKKLNIILQVISLLASNTINDSKPVCIKEYHSLINYDDTSGRYCCFPRFRNLSTGFLELHCNNFAKLLKSLILSMRNDDLTRWYESIKNVDLIRIL